MKDANNAVVM